MSETNDAADDLSRKQRVRAVLEDCIRRRDGGEDLPDEKVIAANPDLMPEISEELRKLSAIQQARQLAAQRKAGLLDRAEHASEFPVQPDPGALPGTNLPGYELVREISRGGQAVLYEAIQKATGRKVAAKVLLEGSFAGPRERARFDREAQILAALNHPHIVPILDRGISGDGHLYLVTDYISGKTLDRYLEDYRREKPGNDDPSELLRLFLSIADAVNAAHLRGIVHRDLKPSNIMIGNEGEPHIVDFGLARAPLPSVTDEQRPQPVTITGQFIGSLPWASPEQAEGISSKIDIRSDVYSLGVILYQMLTGQFPYEVVGTMRDVLNNILTVQPRPPSEVLAAKEAKARLRNRRWRGRQLPINEQIEAIVLKALSKSREQRYQSAGDLARDISAYLSGQPTIAAGAAALARQQAAQWSKRLQSAAMIAGCCALAGMLGWLSRCVYSFIASLYGASMSTPSTWIG